MPGKLCSWKSVHIKRKPPINICFEGRLALRRKQNISALELKLKTKCLFLLDCWPTVVCLLLTGSFPINTPSTSKDPTILPRFLPSKSFCCHGNLVFSGNPVSWHPMIHTWNNVQTLPDSSLRHRVYPVTTVPIFTCCNTRYQQHVTVHREPGLLENKSCIQKGGGRIVVGNPFSYYKADVLKNEGQLNKTLKDFSLFKYLKTLS